MIKLRLFTTVYIADDSITSDMNLSLPENFNPLNENVRNLRDIVMDIVTSKGMLKTLSLHKYNFVSKSILDN